jgi:formylglycine-generating enzyme required for sulfatase activity
MTDTELNRNYEEAKRKEPPILLRIFLCHSSEDKPAIRKLYLRLRAEGFDPWVDEEKLLPGQDWQLEISKAVRASGVVIVCLSRRAVNKAGYIQKEIKFALDIADEQPEGKIFLIPVKLEECVIPERLSRWQWVNLFEKSGYVKLMHALHKVHPPVYKTQEDSEMREKDLQKAKHEKEIPKSYINSIGMKFTLIPAGKFMMGSEEKHSEKPVHKVKINKPFYLGIYPVTQREWEEVMGNSPSYFKGDNLPVERFQYFELKEFIEKINEKEGTDKYRLPSEAEWEYAARAGTTTRYSFGDDESELGKYSWFYNNSENRTHGVGQRMPNPWGLYDIHGNVWELVQDGWHDNYISAPTDGSAWTGIDHVQRGGGWCSFAEYCRSAFRRLGQNKYVNCLGFRLLREL